MDSSFWFDTINLAWLIVNIEGVTEYNFIPNKICTCISFSEEIFVLSNNVDPDDMLHNATFLWILTVCRSMQGLSAPLCHA